MQCIKCGKPVAEGEIFCALCSLSPKAPKDKRQQKKAVSTTSAPKVQVPSKPQPKRHATLADSLNPPSPKEAYAPTKEGKKRNFFPAFLVMLILAFGAMSYIAMMYHQWTEVANLVNQVEGELELYRGDIVDLQAELAETQTALETTDALYDNAVVTIDALENQLNSTENTVNQTQYDMTTQQSELATVEAENLALEQENTLLLEQVTELALLVEDMSADWEEMEAAVQFMDEFVVFVNDDGTNTYHRYGCSAFDSNSFWAYNRSLAESYGNTACPYCIDD